jgi:GT2 family glycosyltransferase
MHTIDTISILVLNWNGESIIEECIDALLETEHKDFEIVVIDNASTDSSLTKLKKYNNIVLRVADKNMGYAGGNNFGFPFCNGSYIVTLNNDIVVDKNWLNDVVPLFKNDPRLAIVSCRQMNYFHRETIDALYSFPTSHLLLGRMGHGQKYDSTPFNAEKGYVIGANGASAIYRKQFLTETGGFETSFFAFQEENDLHMRAFYLGWNCLYLPSAVVYHKGSYSFNKDRKSFYYYHERNRIWFIYRNFPLVLIITYLPILLVREIRTMLNMVLRRRLLLTYIRCRWDGFTGMWQFSDIRKTNMLHYKNKRVLLKLFITRKKLPSIS